MAATISMAAQRDPIVLGKPESYTFEAIQRDHPNIKAERTLMIGDK